MHKNKRTHQKSDTFGLNIADFNESDTKNKLILYEGLDGVQID